MKTTKKRFALTALAYIIPTMILGYVWHLMVFENYYDGLEIYNRAEPIIPLGFASMIIQGLVMSYLYSYYSRSKSSVPIAIKFSLTMGLFLFSVSTLANGAKIHVASMQDWLIIQTLFHVLQFLIAGVLIGLVNIDRKTANTQHR